MKKLGILVDSFCGLRKEEVEKLGIEYISLVVFIDGVEIQEGEKEILTEIAPKILKAKELKTSLPTIGLLKEKFRKMSKKYKNVIYLSINKGLSSTYSVACAAASEMKNIHVVNSRFIGTAAIYNAKKLLKEVNSKNIKDIIKKIKEISKKSHCWVIPKDVQQLIKSGRLTGVKKIIMEKTKLIPQLYLKENGFSVKGIKKSFYKTIDSILKKTISKIKKNGKLIDDFIWEIIHTTDQKTLESTKKIMKENGIKKYNVTLASSSTTCHSGIGSIGIQAYIK